MARKSELLLVVDDELLNRDMLSRRLQRSGYQVAVAENGEQALHLIRTQPFDLVLLDNMMPGLSGLEVLKLVRATHSAEQLPVIMVTAQSESENVVRALDLGANDYVTKPIDFPVASARIRNQLSRKMAEEALRESEERYALAARGANDGLWDWNLKNDRIYYSPRWKQMLGYAEEEVTDGAEEWLGRVHPADAARVRQEIANHLAGQSASLESEQRIRHRDGAYRWMLVRGVAVRDRDGSAVRMAGSQTDVTEGKTADPLTSLPNRVFVAEKLQQAIDRARGLEARGFAVLFLDIDGFKVINDSLGHIAGDYLLVAIAERLRSGVRSSEHARLSNDVVGRMGGDEFAVLLDDVDSVECATCVAERILHELSAPFHVQGHRVFSSASIGIALGGVQYENPEEVLRDADTAMYHAKSKGKSRFEVFDSSMRDRAVARLKIESELRRAITNEEFVVHYQPKVRLDTGKVTGFEALCRWNHPERGLVSPAEFIPVAEETGLIMPLGTWVLRQACLQMAAWHKQFPGNPPLTMNVNLSCRQFAQPDLVETVRRVLQETGLDPVCLKLEITESVLLENPETVRITLDRLREMNVGLKMDDFGTGYSSLSYLHRLPFDGLKIDRSFIVRMGENQESTEVVHTIIQLARMLGMNVVAEGVETNEQVRQLQAFGCDFGQGFYFFRPLEASAAERLISDAGNIDDAPNTAG